MLIENPAVVFADVAVVFIVPSSLLLPEPLAAHPHATYVVPSTPLISLSEPPSPSEKPSVPKAVMLPVEVTSAVLSFVEIVFKTPLNLSNTK